MYKNGSLSLANWSGVTASLCELWTIEYTGLRDQAPAYTLTHTARKQTKKNEFERKITEINNKFFSKVPARP